MDDDNVVDMELAVPEGNLSVDLGDQGGAVFPHDHVVPLGEGRLLPVVGTDGVPLDVGAGLALGGLYNVTDQRPLFDVGEPVEVVKVYNALGVFHNLGGAHGAGEVFHRFAVLPRDGGLAGGQLPEGQDVFRVGKMVHHFLVDPEGDPSLVQAGKDRLPGSRSPLPQSGQGDAPGGAPVRGAKDQHLAVHRRGEGPDVLVRSSLRLLLKLLFRLHPRKLFLLAVALHHGGGLGFNLGEDLFEQCRIRGGPGVKILDGGAAPLLPLALTE